MFFLNFSFINFILILLYLVYYEDQSENSSLYD